MADENSLDSIKREIGEVLQDFKSTTACFTGHRSQKLPWRFNESDPRCLAMKQQLNAEIESAIQRGYRTFLSGMALGFDMMCAEAVIEFRRKYPDITLIGAIPCEDQDCKWQERDKKRYRALLEQLDGKRCIYDTYVGVECMLERNRYMVNRSSLLIALFDGLPGGTKKTIDYAMSQGLEIRVIKP